MTERVLDNRGLPPPEPMVRILEALASLQPGEVLIALMDRDPVLLYPELDRRGFASELLEDGEHYRLRMFRA